MSMSSNSTENLIVLNCSFVFFIALFTTSRITTFADIHICIFPSLVN